MMQHDINFAYMDRTAELRTLKSFIVVAREGNMSRAAEILNLTQPAISLQLKRLAEDTGLTLFQRTSKGVTLTDDGAVLLAKAENVFAALSDFTETAKQINGRIRGKLRIGTIVDPGFLRVGPLLAQLVESYPDLETELFHSVSGEVIAQLLKGKIDIGYFLGDLDVLGPSDNDGPPNRRNLIHCRALTEITYRVIAPAGWEKDVIGQDWQDLAKLPWIGTPPESVHSRLLRKTFAEIGCTQNNVAQVDQESSMLAIVGAGVGLSLCREATALEQSQEKGLVVADKVHVKTPLSIVTLRSRLDDPKIRAMNSIIDKIWSPQP